MHLGVVESAWNYIWWKTLWLYWSDYNERDRDLPLQIQVESCARWNSISQPLDHALKQVCPQLLPLHLQIMWFDTGTEAPSTVIWHMFNDGEFKNPCWPLEASTCCKKSTDMFCLWLCIILLEHYSRVMCYQLWGHRMFVMYHCAINVCRSITGCNLNAYPMALHTMIQAVKPVCLSTVLAGCALCPWCHQTQTQWASEVMEKWD